MCSLCQMSEVNGLHRSDSFSGTGQAHRGDTWHPFMAETDLHQQTTESPRSASHLWLTNHVSILTHQQKKKKQSILGFYKSEMFITAPSPCICMYIQEMNVHPCTSSQRSVRCGTEDINLPVRQAACQESNGSNFPPSLPNDAISCRAMLGEHTDIWTWMF